ncbi:MAG: hypothetical protein HY592_02685 [Candidatus Omnitrophica bacterium]|nr:hypothetical protein [Candidatus Omnitrophota bacterium]
MAGLLIFLYVHYGLFPGRLKDTLLQKIEAKTQHKVLFDKALLVPFEGFTLYNFKVFKSNGSLLFSARKFAVNVKIIPFIQENKIVISNLHLDWPIYHHAPSPRPVAAPDPPPRKSKLSGQTLLPAIPAIKKWDWSIIEEGPDSLLPENVYLEQIEIANGLVTARGETFQAINIRLGFQKPPHLTFKGSVILGENIYAQVALRGSWDLEKAEYDFNLRADFNRVPPWLADYQKNNFLILKEGDWVLDVILKSIGEEKCRFHARADLRDARFGLRQMEILGRLLVDTEGVFHFPQKHFDHYKGRLELLDVAVLGASEQIEELNKLKGLLRFEPDRIIIDSIEGLYKDAAFKLSGRLDSFSQLLVNLKIHMDSRMEKILALLPAQRKKFLSSWLVEGACHAVTTLTGSLKKPAELRMEHELVIENALIASLDKKIRLERVHGALMVNDSGLAIRNGRFFTSGQDYTVQARLPKKTGETAHLELASKDLRLTTDAVIGENRINIEKAQARYRGIHARFNGTLTDFEKPWIDLHGEARADAGKLEDAFQKEAPFLKNFGLRGALEGRFLLKGFTQNLPEADLKLDLRSRDFILHQKIHLTDFEMQIRMKDKILNIPYFHAKPYGGTFGGNAVFDLTKPKTAFETRLRGNQLDLARLLRDLEVKTKDLSGKAIFQISLKGILQDQASFKGEGAFDVSEGSLWKTDLFKAMGRLPLVRVEGLDNVTFRSMSATFRILDKRVWTDDLSLFSETVDLSLKGSAGFDKSLDLLMDIQYSNSVLLGAEDTGGIAPLVVREASNFISQYRVAGTLTQPTYNKA